MPISEESQLLIVTLVRDSKKLGSRISEPWGRMTWGAASAGVMGCTHSHECFTDERQQEAASEPWGRMTWGAARAEMQSCAHAYNLKLGGTYSGGNKQKRSAGLHDCWCSCMERIGRKGDTEVFVEGNKIIIYNIYKGDE